MKPRSLPFARVLLAMPFALAATSLVALPSARTARADDAPEDPSSLLRRARAAETADRDVRKAIELYRAVVASGGTTDAARDAALRLADLHEVRGERGAAVEDLKLVTERFGDRLDDATKRRVHESLARLLPAGSHARSPLGDVYVLPTPGAAANPVGSPLETKILAILSRLDEASPLERDNIEYAVQSALEPVGLEALPVLERVMNGDRPERARFAAQAYARLGKAASLPGLVKAIREGDGFTRASAIGGLGVLKPAVGVSVPFVNAVTPLLDLPQVQDRRALIREALAPHLTDEDLLAREAAGGPDATYWLSVAVKRSLPEAVARVQAITKQGGALPPDVVRMLGEIAGATVRSIDWNAGTNLVATNPRLPGNLRLAMLEAVASQAPTTETADACGSIGGIIVRTAVADEAARASEVAWAHVLSMSDLGQRSLGMLSLARYGVAPSPKLLEDGARMSAYMAALGVAHRSSTFSNGHFIPRQLLGKPLQAMPAFWKGVAGVMQAQQVDPSQTQLATWLTQNLETNALPPPELDATWIAVLEHLASEDYRYWDAMPWALRAAARSGDARFLGFVRREIEKHRTEKLPARTLLTVLADTYVSADRAPFAAELLLILHFDGSGMEHLIDAVAAEPTFWKALLPPLEKAVDSNVSSIFGFLGKVIESDFRTPPEVDALFLPFATRAIDYTNFPIFVWRAIVGSNGPAAFAATKALATSKDEDALERARIALRLWAEVPSEESASFLDALLHDPATSGVFDDSGIAETLVKRVATGPHGDARLMALAKDPLAPGNADAVEELVATGEKHRATLAAFFTANAWRVPESRFEWRSALVEAASSLHLTESIPFLLQEFRAGQPEKAARAMDDIRAYHERLAAFQGYAGGSQSAIASVLSMLDASDPDLRLAAVRSYAALAGKEGLPRLLQVAKDEKDATVRKAALDAIERISLAATAPSPAVRTVSGQGDPAPTVPDEAPSK